MKALGGPRNAALVHRVSAVVLLGCSSATWSTSLSASARNWRTFEWFGPNSLMPSWQDLRDIVAMFKWFFGLAPRPVFDRWTYWEKFDYWAPFWGVTIIGVSGLMLWFKEVTASLLPGWVFNVAMLPRGRSVPRGSLPVHRAFFQQSLPAGQVPAGHRDVHRRRAVGRIQARAHCRIR